MLVKQLIGLLLSSASLILTSVNSFSQGRNFTGNVSQAQQFYSDANGRPLFFRVEYVIEGTPFHPMSYYLATIVLSSGQAYEDIPVKFNLMENLVIYKTSAGEELVATSPVEKVIFTDTSDYGLMKDVIFERGFSPIGKLDTGTFYEVLHSGQIHLLKHYRVSFTDRKPYASASITRVFGENQDYYISLADGSMKKLEKGVDNLVNILSDKKQLISQFINSENLKCKKESDWIKVINYYNSLFKG